MLLTEPTAKNLEYRVRLLNAFEHAGRLDEAASLARWMRGEEARQKVASAGDPSLLPSKLELMHREIGLTERLEEERLRREIEARRYRLGADPLPVLREKIRSEICAASDLDTVMTECLVEGEKDKSLELAEKLLDRLLRRIPLTKDFTQTSLLLQIAQQYRQESSLAQGILLDFCDYDALPEVNPTTTFPPTGSPLGPYEMVRGVAEMGEQQLVEELGQLHPASLFVALLVLGEFWRRCELLHTQTWIGTARSQAKRLAEQYGFSCERTQRLLRRLEGLLLAEDERWQEAVAKLEEFQEEPAVVEQLVRCHSRLLQHDQAIRLYRRRLEEEPHSVALLQGLGWEYYQCRDFVQAQRCLEQALAHQQGATENDPATESAILTRLARVMWDADEAHRRDKTTCLRLLLSAAKADPLHAEPFLFLGHYYAQIEGDMGRAEKCYAKALHLDCDCVAAALELGGLWLRLIRRQPTDAPAIREILQRTIRVLEPFSTLHFRSARLWMYLGIALSALGKYPAATTAFQNALKGEHPDTQRCLLGLAEGYRRQGRLAAALKAYERILDTDASCQGALLGQAAVYGALREHARARSLLQAEAQADGIGPWLQLERLQHGAHHLFDLLRLACTKEATSLLLELLDSSQAILLLDGVEAIVRQQTLKILSDLCVQGVLPLRNKLMDADAYLLQTLGAIQERLANEFVNDNDGIWEGIRTALPTSLPPGPLAAIQVACLCQVHLVVEHEEGILLSTAWTDLAAVLLLALASDDGGDGEAKELLLVAKDCAEQAVSSMPAEERPSATAWTVLGVVCLRLDSLGPAQHYLIQAVRSDPQHWEAWLALAHLYSTVGEEELATLAAGTVQLGASNSSPGWIYQLLVDQRGGGARHRDSNRSDKDPRLALKHAAEQSEPCWHALHLLSALNQLEALCQQGATGDSHHDSPSLAELVSDLRVAAWRRLAFVPNDLLAGRLASALDSLVSQSIPRLAAVEDQLCAQLEDTAPLREEGQAQEPPVGEAGHPNRSWTAPLILARQGKIAEALETQLARFTAGPAGSSAAFHCPPLWEDLLFWHGQLRELDPDVVDQRAREWLRMRITPELAERLYTVPAIEAIRQMWGDGMPEELSRLLANNGRFLGQWVGERLMEREGITSQE